MDTKGKLAGILAAVLVGLKVAEFVLSWLGNMDFVVEKINDPGWLGKVVNFLLFDPPAWFSNTILIIALLLLIYLSIQLSKTKREHKPSILDIQGSKTSLDILVESEVSKKEEVKPAQNQVTPAKPDPRKIEIIETIYWHFQNEHLPLYDKMCDVANAWRKTILEKGTKYYISDIEVARRTNKWQVCLWKYIEDNKIYYDVFETFRDRENIGSSLGTVIGEFKSRLQKLPDNPKEETLELIEEDAKKFGTAIGKYGQWVRGNIDKAVELKKKEESKK